MASRQHYLAIVGVRDVAHFLAAFEDLNTCILSLSLSVRVANSRPDLTMKMYAHTRPSAGVERVLLASASSDLAAENFQTLDAAIMFCLYKLDSELARLEFSAVETK